ncbi:MAG: hypothetical protein GOMPHAMPRED_005306 [Gomphillus americanus]|uniref:C2H2-type domain-containing protein n=1 Tax=Gomphillus americanus TaxID=1940652 RepID=A0A8H3IVZ6_9LECA|nr:MAG: hypothetical protein GOMPHAMPRED_005306 [Gomphillus americanus]
MASSQDTAHTPVSTSATDASLTVPPSSATRKRLHSPDPASLSKPLSPLAGVATPTGISEMAEAKRRKLAKSTPTKEQLTSINPAVEALNALSASQATSKVSSAPANTAYFATSIIPSTTSAAETATSSTQTSPTTVVSEAPSTELIAQQVASPGAMDQDEGEDSPAGNKAFSYPPPLPTAHLDAKRGMSLPGSASRDNGKSPAAAKKHKCPFCSTEFTRHHNLKSHLLTHSHEKPYLCQTCDSRFRRLHDLKRHTKLHTGERPHICPICKRKFARGDALARHAKGQGGCAGRRSSIGEYIGEEDGMEGMVYADGQSHESENIEDDDGAGSSVPSIRHHAPVHLPPYRSESSPIFARGGSTYPPIAARADMRGSGGLLPPGGAHSSSSVPSGSYSGQQYPPAGVFPTSQMTESPKPLSPGLLHSGDPRDRSGPMGQPFGQRGTRNTPPPSLPPPATTSNHLPSLSKLAPPDSRYVLHSTPGASGPSPTLPHPTSGTFPPHSASNSLSSHGTGHHGSGERGNLTFAAEDRLWAVIKSLEAKIDRLEDEVRTLRAQQTSPSQTSSSALPLGPPTR